MKIAIVCYPTFGGSGVVATELGKELSFRGHEIHFITYKQPVRLDDLNEKIRFHQVHVPEYPLFLYQPYELALSSKLVNIVKEYHIDVVHVHYAIPHAYAAYMAKAMLRDIGLNISIVTTLHGTDITLIGNHPYYKPAVTFSINNSDIVTAVSESLKRDTIRLFNVKKDIEVVPNFIDNSKFPDKKAKCKKRHLATDDEMIITHISNFRKVKRIDDVVKSFYEVQKSLKSRLVMVGDGPEKEKAERLCESLKISDRVIFLGNSDEVDKILCFTDLFLLPSESESFGFAALEAMANGVPIISTNVGGLPEINIDNQTGFLCDVGDIEALSNNMIKLLSDSAKLQVFKKNAKKRAITFDVHEIVPKYEKLYNISI